jgi:hypothetical protein
MESSIVEWLASNPAWGMVIFVGITAIITRLFDAGLGARLPKWSLPWISAVVGAAGQASIALTAGRGWKDAILFGVFGLVSGLAGAGGYSAGLKNLPGMKADRR